MKRNLKADGEIAIDSPKYPKSQEGEFEKLASHMVDVISRRFENQAIKAMDQTTVKKFADAQTGNFAKVFVTLAKRVRRKMVRQFDDKRIEAFVASLLAKTNKHNRAQLYAMVEKRIGIPAKELMATEGLSSTINALEMETTQWMKRLRDQTLEDYTANTLRVMAEGGSLSDVLEQYSGMVEKRKNHAKFTARNQIANYNSLVTKARAQNLGITKARWVTANDERVRGNPGGKYPDAKPDHWWAEGKEFDLSEGLKFPSGKTLLPGIDYQCRCTYELIIPEDD